MTAALPKMQLERHRIAYIDGLRAVAVLGVVLCHTAELARLKGPLAFFMLKGAHGVDLFFVLSGFCLAFPTLSRLRSGGSSNFDVARYAAHRLVRIVPPYWIAIASLAAFAAILGRAGHAPLEGMPAYALSAADVLRQTFFVDWGTKFLNVSFWTLPIEFRWYFLFPVILLAWVRYPKSFAAIAIAALLIGWRFHVVDAWYLPEFMLGVVAAEIRARNVTLSRATFVSVALVALLAVSLDAFWPVAAFALVVGAGSLAVLAKGFSARWLTAVGLASYSIYLIHLPVMSLARDSGANPIVGAAVGVAAGFAFWSIAERPFVSTRIRTELVTALQSFFNRQRVIAHRSIELAPAAISAESTTAPASA